MFVDKNATGFYESPEHYEKSTGNKSEQAGLIEVTDEDHKMLMSKLNNGNILAIDGGRVTTVFHVTTDNKTMKESLLKDADAVIQPMLGYAVAGILSDAEKETFKAWNEYRKALEDADVTAADIEWPAKPA